MSLKFFMHYSASSVSIPAAMNPVKPSPNRDPRGAINPAIAVAWALSSSANHRLDMTLRALSIRGLAVK